jgi:predicted membrane channel-forming protein YqfA (hemolysin III family)
VAEGDQETHAERLDRELIELLNEIRVVLPGVQVIFAFLLAVPFASGFEDVTSVQRNAYALSLVTALGSIVCLVAPTTYHRIQWRQRDKETMLRTANLLAIAGSAFLAVSLTAATFLVGDYLFSRTVALAATIGAGFAFAALWYALPLARRAT